MTDPIVAAFAVVVRQRRKALGLTQAQMGDLPRNTVTAVERAQMVPSLVVVERFAAALSTTPEELLEAVSKQRIAADEA